MDSVESTKSTQIFFTEPQKDSNNSIESAKDSNVLDCHDSATQNLAMTAEGDSVESAKMDSHAKTCGLSHNDAPLLSLRGSPQGLTKQSINLHNEPILSLDSCGIAIESIIAKHFEKCCGANCYASPILANP